MKKIFANLTLSALALGFFASCEDVPSPYFILEEEENNPTETGVFIDETFASEFGVFSPYAEATEGYTWAISYSSAYISGYQDQTNKATKTWLIAEPIDLTAEDSVCVSFDYIYRYARTSCKELIRVSTDYSGDYSTATWTDLDITLKEGSDYTTFYNTGANLPASVLGKSNVTVALYYEASIAEASTWEVKNFTVKRGVYSSSTGDGGDTPTETTRENPYTVEQAQSNQGSTAWVKGYIVGYVSAMSLAESATFAIPTEAQTEILVASSADETNYANCLPVQLPAGAVRSALDLFANPGNYKKEVILYGSLETYFGTGGMKTTSFAIINGASFGTDPDNTGGEGDPDAYIYESFTTSFGDFNVYTELTDGAAWTIKYNTAYISGYLNGTNIASKSWLISPLTNLSDSKNAYVSFDYIYRYARASAKEVVRVSADYAGDVTKATWTDLDITLTEGSDYTTFYKAGANLPASVVGKGNITIALYYESTDADASTWEVKNFTVKEGSYTSTGTGEGTGTGTGSGTGTGEGSGEGTGSGSGSGDKTLGTIAADGSITLSMTDLGLENATDLGSYTLADGSILTFAQNGGNNVPKYYDLGSCARMYALNSVSISSANKKISNVELTCIASYLGNETLYANADGAATTVTKSETAISIVGNNSSTINVVNDHTAISGGTQLRIVSIKVSYAE